jgi:hypothetical protein
VKAHLVYAIVLMSAVIIVIQPVMAITQTSIPFFNSCDFAYIEPLSFTDATIIEFNDINMACNSANTLGISFPAFANGLPFGLVNLAFPSITQSADNSYTYQRAYFFSDTSE